jgi:hypothetical protein
MGALVCRGVYHLKFDDRSVDILAVLAARLRGGSTSPVIA